MAIHRLAINSYYFYYYFARTFFRRVLLHYLEKFLLEYENHFVRESMNISIQLSRGLFCVITRPEGPWGSRHATRWIGCLVSDCVAESILSRIVLLCLWYCLDFLTVDLAVLTVISSSQDVSR